MLTRKHYEDSLTVQDACNLSGVVFSFAEAMQAICEESNVLGKGTDWKNNHPIAVLYASKIASLTGCEISLNFSEAYDKVKAVLEA